MVLIFPWGAGRKGERGGKREGGKEGSTCGAAQGKSIARRYREKDNSVQEVGELIFSTGS